MNYGSSSHLWHEEERFNNYFLKQKQSLNFRYNLFFMSILSETKHPKL